jgi:anti-sigma factor RsiW
MTCRELIDFLMEYTNGELPNEERQAFDRHLGSCIACRSYLDTYIRAVEMGRTAFADDETLPSDVPEDLVQAILAARGERGKSL